MLVSFPCCVFLELSPFLSDQRKHILVHLEDSRLDHCPLPSYEPWQWGWAYPLTYALTHGSQARQLLRQRTEALAKWQEPRSQRAQSLSSLALDLSFLSSAEWRQCLPQNHFTIRRQTLLSLGGSLLPADAVSYRPFSDFIVYLQIYCYDVFSI